MPGKDFRGQWNAVAIAAVVLLAFSVLFGGASREHALRVALVELIALPLLVLAGGQFFQSGIWRTHRFAIGLLAAVVAIPLIQLLPLPPAVWTGLPGRAPMALALDLTGVQPGWAPLSVVPELTWRSALALLPPIAIFITVLSAPPALAVRLVRAFILAAVVSVLLGAAQLASENERLYPWATTAAGSVSGLFANHNHLASFLLATLPFAVVLGAGSLRRRSPNRFAMWFAAVFVALAVVGLAAIRSKAGVILFAPVMTTSLLAVWIASGRGRPTPTLLVLLGATAAALTAVVILALPPILARFGAEYTATGRFDRWPIVAEAADAYLPLGSGIGSFNAVYRSVEPLNQLDNTFFNQAHNEYVETWLEAGWLGAALMLAFAVWYVRRTWSAWKAPPSRIADLQRAASIAIGALLVHSIVDYPLRTIALAVLFALCCGLLELSRTSAQSA